MKKFNKITMAVVIISAIFAAAATFTSCDGSKSSDKGYSISTRWQGYRIIDNKLVAIDNNGDPTELPRELAQQLVLKAERIYREEGNTPLSANSLNPHILPSTTGSTSTSFPYNYGINNEVTANLVLNWNGVLLRPLDTFFVKGYHQVDNTANGPFMEQSHTQYTLCRANGSTVVLYGDSVSCRQNFVVREILPEVIHDTITIVQVDTVIQWITEIVHDTVIDGRWVTRWESRTRVVVTNQHTSTTTTDTYDNTTHVYTVKCSNRTDSVFTERLYIEYNDGSIDSSAVHTWCVPINWYKVWTRTVTLNGANPGSGRVNVVSNTANFGGGASVGFSNPTVTTTPTAGMENTTDCNNVLVYVTSVTGGVNVRTVVRHGNSADSTQGFIPWNGQTPPTPPTIIRIDRQWGNCTTAENGAYNPYTEIVNFIVHKNYRWDTVYSDGSHQYSNWRDSAATYSFVVTRVGQPFLSMINNVPVAIGADNTATFGSGSQIFTETLTPIGVQGFCPLTLTTSVLTSNGTVWTGSYGSSTPTVTIAEQWGTTPPTPPDTTINVPGRILFIGNTLSVQNDITPGMVNPEYYLNLVYEAPNGDVHQWITPSASFTLSSTFVDHVVAATASQIQSYVANQQWPAKCYNHVNQTYVPGTVDEVTGGNGWVERWFSYTNRTMHYNTINSNSNVFVNGVHPPIKLGDHLTGNGTLTINGIEVHFSGTTL